MRGPPCLLQRPGLVIDHQIIGQHQFADIASTIQLQIEIGLAETTPHNRQDMKQGVGVVFPLLHLLGQLPIHVLGDASGPGFLATVRVFTLHGAPDNLVALANLRVGPGCKLDSRHSHQRILDVGAPRPGV